MAAAPDPVPRANGEWGVKRTRRRAQKEETGVGKVLAETQGVLIQARHRESEASKDKNGGISEN